MKNKNVGFLVIGIAVLMAIIVFLFQGVIKDNLDLTCSHGPTCEMYSNLNVQTWVSFVIVGIVLAIGLFLVFSKEEVRIVTKIKTRKVHIEKKSKPIDYSKLDKDEKIIIKAVEEADGTIFQSDLVEKTEFSKVKVSRILDKLEGRQLIERKRRGMTNVVVLK
jgi:hypothetical protein